MSPSGSQKLRTSLMKDISKLKAMQVTIPSYLESE